MPLSISCSLVQSHFPRFTTPQQQNEANHARIVNQELTQCGGIDRNARRRYRTWTSCTVHHLPDANQWDYDVLKPYIGHCVPIQSYLRFFARGPPLMAHRDSLNFVCRARKSPRKDCSPF